MSLHPNPSENMLLPYMHNNIAQICRTWITSSILNSKIILPEWLNDVAALSSSSIPAYLFPWTSTTTGQTPSPNRGTTPETADKWLSLLLTSAWTFNEKVWQFCNKVVLGQLEEFRESKTIQNLRGRIKELYFQFREDLFMVPHTRSHLFNKPMEATSSMDKDGLACWIKSVEEAILTREHRDQLEAVHLRSTLHHFFKSGRCSHKSKTLKRYIPTLWDAPFSAKYYQRPRTGRRKSRPLRQTSSHSTTTTTRLRNKTKRKHATPHPIRTLMEFGFRQQPVHPLVA
jgi:hypothetical protein